MDQADGVHSTPPTNTPIDTTRRRFLAVAVGASVASVGTLAAAAMPIAAPYSAACAVDPIYAAIEIVCKGLEVELPPGISFKDKEGKIRNEVRVRWWEEDLSTYRKAAIGPPGDMEMIPDVPMPAEWVGHPYVGPPVLFGHYWFSGTPRVISSRFACLDYSAARDGPLVAYRWDGEAELSSDKIAWM